MQLQTISSRNFVAGSGPAKRGGAGAAGGPKRKPLSTSKLPRAYLEEAFVRLTEENARLRREIVAQSALWRIAHQDPLTELWNRRYANERLAEEMSRAKRENNYRFSMVLVDVDNMKRINDQMGHASGDKALKWVAGFLKQGLRGHDLCCRLGGDEFLLILPGSDEKDCHDLMERIVRRWLAAAEADDGAVAISMGTASFPAEGQTVERLLGVADEAMYENKRRQDPTRPSRMRKSSAATEVAADRPPTPRNRTVSY